jgi:hypothetical protein
VEEKPFLKVGDHIWVGSGMASGFNLPFGQKLTVKKVRVLFMKEARIYFEELKKRYYLRTDFGDSYAFREDPGTKYHYTPEQWEVIRRGEISKGMSKTMFLCIKPKSEEIHYQTNPAGPIEQWIYRENPVDMFGSREANPPTEIYYFQNDVLIEMLLAE